MKERKEPVPPYHPCADNDDNVEHVKRLSYIRGERSGGRKNPDGCSGFY